MKHFPILAVVILGSFGWLQYDRAERLTAQLKVEKDAAFTAQLGETNAKADRDNATAQYCKFYHEVKMSTNSAQTTYRFQLALRDAEQFCSQ